MGAKPILYSLFWRPEIAAPLPSKRTARVALQHLNTFDEPEPVPAILLYPAFLTPAVHVAGTNDEMFEILIFSRKGPTLTVSDVNLHLKISKGLDQWKRATDQPLFANPEGNITIEQVTPDGNGILATRNLFKGQIHKTFLERLKNDAKTKPLGAYYAVSIHESCLRDDDVLESGPRTATREFQDDLVEATLKKMNGHALRGEGGRGTHCFGTIGGRIDMTKIDQDQPIRAYHPLFVYPASGLSPASFGHVSDIHINARQELMMRSPARVIDDPNGEADSPEIGSLMNVCSYSFHAILEELGSDESMDVLFAGGDYVDHSHNVYPYHGARTPESFKHMTAKMVWNLMDLTPGANYDQNYQAFVDLLYFYGEMRWFMATYKKPVIGITGNHDCYEGAFGVSPRKLGVRANEGIPADLNLTYYEAILAFGRTWDLLQKNGTPFSAPLFEWYYTVFTPWSDFAIELPEQRVVALAWGEDEEIVSFSGSMGQGVTHLPRAEEAVTDEQLALFNAGLRPAKKSVLLTHFTFVSYLETVRETDSENQHLINVHGPTPPLDSYPLYPFSEYDMGTFEMNRRALYAAVANPALVQCVITGHSHRKGLYFLGPLQSKELYPTQMYGLLEPVALASIQSGGERTPIIVSDSAGPLPRRNFNNEFKEWGSDRPGGSLIVVKGGRVAQVQAVPVPRGGEVERRAKPRLEVALEYLHVSKKEVFDEIETDKFPPSRAQSVEHGLNITFKKEFPSSRCQLTTLTLYCRASSKAPWKRIPLAVGPWIIDQEDQASVHCGIALRYSADFYNDWLNMAPKSGRFMSMRFKLTDRAIKDIYAQENAWNIEVDCRPAFTNFPFMDATYVVIPSGALELPPGIAPEMPGEISPPQTEVNPRMIHEAPSFEWRERFKKYQ
jgi:calcineurin-like phosphoesterase family protein